MQGHEEHKGRHEEHNVKQKMCLVLCGCATAIALAHAVLVAFVTKRPEEDVERAMKQLR
jgi:hypothetical protein